MLSKRSWFNLTLFRKNLNRSWPLWGTLSLIGAMEPLYLLLETLHYNGNYVWNRSSFATALYESVAFFAPGFTAFYAILCAMLAWGYLYNARSISLMHALPVNRTCLFITGTLSGLTVLVIPYAVTGLLLCLLALGLGAFDLAAVLNTVLAVVFLALLFFGLATLCAMLTGHMFALPALYLLLNFLSWILEDLISTLAESFLLGFDAQGGLLTFLSPLVEIYSRFHPRYYCAGDGKTEVSLTGLWIVALYALAGLGLLALAWFLYTRRHSECAGDVVAFRWMRPVFRYGIALLSGLTLGRLLYEMMWHSLFQTGRYADALPMFVCIAVTGLMGYYAASMLLEKTRRVFRGSLLGAGAVCAGAAALCLMVSTDMFGVERRVPVLDEIESVQIMDRGEYNGPFKTDGGAEQVEKIRAFHQAVVVDRSYIRSYSPNWNLDEGNVFSHSITLTYQLKNGSAVTRTYDLWVSRDRVAQEGTYDNLLAAFYQDSEVRRQRPAIPENGVFSSIDVLSDFWDSSPFGQPLYDALLKDAEEGNIPPENVLDWEYDFYDFNSHYIKLQIEYRLPVDPQSESWTYNYKSVYVSPAMEHTVQALIDGGFFTEEDARQWAEAWTDRVTET